MFAQQPSISVSRITQEGNSLNATSTFVQDKLGFVWFGTINGLMRYDGTNFKTYQYNKKDKNSISSNIIRALVIDNSGVLWVGTQGGGLNKFDSESNTFTSFRHSSSNDSSLINNDIWTLFNDSDDNLWIGTLGGGVDKFNKKTGVFTHYKQNSNNARQKEENDVSTITEDYEGIIWIGTSGGGLMRLEKDKGIVQKYTHKKGKTNTVASNEVYAISQIDSTNFWIASFNGGLQKFNKNTGNFTFSKHNDKIHNKIHALTKKQSGKLAVATNEGLYLIEDDEFIKITKENYPNMPDNRLRGLFVDIDDNLWLGFEGGAAKLVENHGFFSFKHNSIDINSISTNTIRSVFEDKDSNLWIGTMGQGLNKYNFISKKFNRIDFDDSDLTNLTSEITSVFEDSNSNFWIATWYQGIFLFDKEKLKVIKNYSYSKLKNSISDNRVQSIIEEKPGVLWIGTENGLNRFDYIKNKWTNFVFESDNPNSVSGNKYQSKALTIDKNGVIWAGTWASGLNAIIPIEGSENAYDIHSWKNNSEDTTSLISNSILALEVDKKGNLWIGSFGNGIGLLSAEQVNGIRDSKEITFKNYTIDNGLINNVIYGILEDDFGDIWISTESGLSRYNSKTNKFKSYKKGSGLLGNQFYWGASGKAKGGLYFGGVDGLNLIIPSKINEKNKKLHLELTDIVFFEEYMEQKLKKLRLNKNITEIKELQFSKEHAFFTLKYIALNYDNSNTIQYAFLLEGYDDKWINVNEKMELTFSQLQAGDYTFKLKARGKNKQWTKPRILIQFKVLPYWWETTWFKSIITLLISSIIASVFYYRFRVLKKQRHELELKVEERTKELFEKNKQLKIQNLNIAKQKEKTEKINKELNDFAYIISHDLKAPLRGINQLASWISTDYSDKFDDDGKEQMQMLMGRVIAMDGMINGVLQYSRATNFTGKFKIINLNELLNEIIELILPPKHIEITTNNQLPEIKGDRVRIMQVFQNLISNAIKYMDKPKGFIKISYSDENTHWQFNVEDNGPGIDKKYHENIFKIFQTISSQQREDSTGIGLSIVKKIVQIYKGKIWVDSELGKGSKFSFTLIKKIK